MKEEILRYALKELIKLVDRPTEDIELAVLKKAKQKFPNAKEEELIKLVKEAVQEALKLTFKERIHKLRELKQNKRKKTKQELQKKIKTRTPRAEEYVKRAQTHRRLAELNSQIKKKGVFRVSPQFKANSGTIDATRLQKSYYVLIGEKTLKKDKQLMDDIIKHRKQILQHRISCEVRMYSAGKAVAAIKMYHTLIEHGHETVNYWTGQTIDTSSFPEQVERFQSHMSQFGVKEVVINQQPNRKETVQYVTTDYVFA